MTFFTTVSAESDTRVPLEVNMGTRAARVQRRKQIWMGYAFISPATILFLIFVLGPLIAAFVLSLYSWDLLTTPKFVGLANFGRLISDPLVWRSLGNTFIFAFASIATHLIAGLLLALAVNRGMNKVINYFVRAALFFPFVISWAAVALLWKFVLDPTFGIVNYYLGLIGVSSPHWFNDPAWALPGIIGIDFWHTIGYTFLILLAGLQTVPRELLEAARTDGANSWQTFWNVTIPLMSPTIFFATIVTFISAFQLFDPIQIITQGGPNNSTLTVVMYMYEQGFQNFQVGYGSAIALLIFIVIMTVTIVQFIGSRRWVYER